MYFLQKNFQLLMQKNSFKINALLQRKINLLLYRIIKILRIDESDPCETLCMILGKNITPYFKSYVKESRRGDRDGVKLAPTIEKSLNEAEVAIRHLQQNIDIPEVNLQFNSQVQNAVNKARTENRKPSTNDLGNLVEDSNFLNNLQQGVNRWITEIRKVTKLDRDPLSGTALQETTFWTNLEQALLRINEIRESDEVFLTLEALKLGKRFHATVSFDTDTGRIF